LLRGFNKFSTLDEFLFFVIIVDRKSSRLKNKTRKGRRDKNGRIKIPFNGYSIYGIIFDWSF